MKEFVIILTGGFYLATVPAEQEAEIRKNLDAVLGMASARRGNEVSVSVTLGTGRFLASAFVAYYVRDPLPNYHQQALDLQKKLLDEHNRGEEWKGEDR